jgi:type VI secretion system protein ImpL
MMEGKSSTEVEMRYSITGYIILIIGLAGICALLLFLNQDRIVANGITVRKAWFIWGSVFLTLLLCVIASPFWLQRKQESTANLQS